MNYTVPSDYYDKHYYETIRRGSERSAEVLVPLMIDLVGPHSVVDVGCGDGSWLGVFRRFGIEEILGIDGAYVEGDTLRIPSKCFRAVDLRNSFNVGRVFDLAVCLEVAEHLPSEIAPTFIECLTRLAPVVLFSAAIPFQGGEHHINEQWPDKWAELFRAHGYFAVDCIRKRVWENEAVEWWYAQNTLLFTTDEILKGNARLRTEFEQTILGQLRLVHPRQYVHVNHLYENAINRIEQMIPRPSGVREASAILLSRLKISVMSRVSSIYAKSTDSDRNTKIKTVSG